ncbi:DNA mismatch repair endonuclease MutL [Clostridium sp. MD294]|uniref:DNA mismatch repair endonuclease MutL n=1 Tax=Clostridium sp. MD294 TaxID=97138 RepID=UPI0002CC4772|nr:DNA mismatch repair endonuclease MutL [Clostridium sp. MD294]NDO46039.1 DNA mismatch repair endonuclease MutL [Clostridium sp. MD294]USF30297.1 DNA mismatch repair protein MutL [Clostridium sp. MD294]
MQKIQLLDNQTINKIAAGEVVESPKSVVKELVENAIDAGATSIIVEIKEGGTSYIRVTDNGHGIAKEQVKMAFVRHATNKIVLIEDLEKILSLGFRGEALASIAGVAQVEMITKTKSEQSGTLIEINGGEIVQFQSAACTEGTSIIVKNLFYNVPARRKFLKKPSTEASHISEILNQFALGHPDIAFKYVNNNTTILHTSGNHDKKTAVLYVYGKDAATKMLEVNYKKGEYSITGLLGKPELSRANRSYENLFINGRYIKNKIISSAIEEAYKTRLLIGKFPVYVLQFSIPPTLVDVNVHPAKLEVRFHNDDEIYQMFYEAVCKTFENEILISKVDWNSKNSKEVEQYQKEKNIKIETTPIQQKILEKEVQQNDLYIPPKQNKKMQIPSLKSVDNLLKNKKDIVLEAKEDITMYASKKNQNDIFEIQSIQTKRTRDTFFKNYKIIGQIFNTYWVIEQSKSIFIIDQHAAHERILYEELMTHLKQKKVISQMLLQPLLLNLTEKEKEILQQNKELLKQFGFSIEETTPKNYALLSVPFIMKAPTNTKFFLDILDLLEDITIKNVYDTKVLTIATMACKAAVKANDKLSITEATEMIEKLLQLENPFTCPHGRPTIIEMTQYELEKRFKRIQN